MKASTIAKDRKYPGFIREAMKDYTTIEKIFPRIGLKNAKSKLKLTKAIKLDKQSALADWDEFDSDYDSFDLFEKMKKLVQSAQLTAKGMEIKFNSKSDLNEMLRPSLRHLSKPSQLFIVFSSEGEKGLWDIATMSDRGIESCMSWCDGGFNEKLVGTITDPYAGIIYLTDGKEDRYLTDERMLARAVVRYVLRNRRPAILIEPIYLNFDDDGRYGNEYDDEEDAVYANIFKDYLRSKLSRSISVVYANDLKQKDKRSISISISTNSNIAKKHDHQSYIDSGVKYQTVSETRAKQLQLIT